MTGTWRLPSVLSVADRQGSRRLPPRDPGFHRSRRAAPDDQYRVQLWAHVRPLESAPGWRWPRLVLMAFVGALILPFRRAAERGYTGGFRESLSWDSDAPEANAGGGGWNSPRRPRTCCLSTRPGHGNGSSTASLGPDAAGRVAWYRPGTYTVPRRHWWTPLIPASWRSAEGRARWRSMRRRSGSARSGSSTTGSKSRPLPVSLSGYGTRSAGRSAPRQDRGSTSAETRPPPRSARELLGTGRSPAGRPSLLVLQAEPVSGEVIARACDDLLEKLALAVDVPRPALPAMS